MVAETGVVVNDNGMLRADTVYAAKKNPIITTSKHAKTEAKTSDFRLAILIASPAYSFYLSQTDLLWHMI